MQKLENLYLIQCSRDSFVRAQAANPDPAHAKICAYLASKLTCQWIAS
jgi:hypothetical protein